jgi:hypothetical protein
VQFVPPGISSFVFNCNRPDTSIRFMITKDSRFLQDSLGGRIRYLDSTIVLPRTIKDTIFYTLRLNRPGLVTVTGVMGECVDTKVFTYLPAANAAAQAGDHCFPADSVRIFSNLSISRVRNYTFYLGNGEFTQDSMPVRYYPPGIFQQGYFAVQDSLGCRDTAFFDIDTRLPDFNITASTDTACLGGSVTYSITDTVLIRKWRFEYLNDSIVLGPTRMSDSLVLTQPGQALVQVQRQLLPGLEPSAGIGAATHLSFPNSSKRVCGG